MIITSAQYQNIYVDGSVEEADHNIKATIEGVEMYVPLDPANTHYAEIMRQVAAGELTIADAD